MNHQVNRPRTLEDWGEYISNLAGNELRSQVIAANTHGFVRTLLAEGFPIDHMESLMLNFVRQLRATGTGVPKGGCYDLVTMALTDPIAMRGPLMSEEEADVLALSYVPAAVDDFDQFDLEAAMDA